MNPILEMSSSWWVKKAQKQRNVGFFSFDEKGAADLGLQTYKSCTGVVTPLHHLPSRCMGRNQEPGAQPTGLGGNQATFGFP